MDRTETEMTNRIVVCFTFELNIYCLYCVLVGLLWDLDLLLWTVGLDLMQKNRSKAVDGKEST